MGLMKVRRASPGSNIEYAMLAVGWCRVVQPSDSGLDDVLHVLRVEEFG
jgi:hypothetical protein